MDKIERMRPPINKGEYYEKETYERYMFALREKLNEVIDLLNKEEDNAK